MDWPLPAVQDPPSSYSVAMARYTLVYGLRLVPEGTLARTDDVRLQLRSGEAAGLTLHTIDGTIPQLRRALDRSRTDLERSGLRAPEQR